MSLDCNVKEVGSCRSHRKEIYENDRMVFDIRSVAGCFCRGRKQICFPAGDGRIARSIGNAIAVARTGHRHVRAVVVMRRI